MSIRQTDQTPEQLAEAIIRLNDEDWETWDGLTGLSGVEGWPPSARDLRDAIAAVIQTEREIP